MKKVVKLLVMSVFAVSLTLSNGCKKYSEIYIQRPAPGTYGSKLTDTTQITASIAGVTGFNCAASFSIGTKVYLGLGYKGGLFSKDFWEWDQTTNVWTRKADYPGNSSGVTVSFSIGTKGYIGFGNDIIDGLTNEFWEYDPSTNSWTQKASLPKSRGMAVGFSIGSKGYIGTGYKDSYTDSNYPGLAYQDFWEWDQATNTWTQKASFGGSSRFGAIGFSIGNKGYIGIGSGNLNNPLTDFWEWDQAKDIWTRKADFVGVSRLRAVGFSIGNKGYIGTGTDDGTTLYKDFWEWDQATDTWIKKNDFGGVARGGAVGFSIGNKGYIGTGGTGSTYLDSTFRDFWEWDQPTNLWIKKTLSQ
jgi:N-acetylneuraminic acid mutarotase